MADPFANYDAWLAKPYDERWGDDEDCIGCEPADVIIEDDGSFTQCDPVIKPGCPAHDPLTKEEAERERRDEMEIQKWERDRDEGRA